MRKIYSRAILGALIGGGLAVVGAGMAHAAETSGTDGLLSGDQAIVSVDLPITVGGNAVSIIGDSHSEDASTSAPASEPAPEATTDGGDGIGSGNQGLVSVDVPVTVGGNAVSVIGDSHSEDASTSAPAEEAASAPAGDVETDGTDSVGGGNQVVAPVEVPVTVGGNAISVIGDSHTEGADTTGGSTSGGHTGDVDTDGTDSLLGGNQALLPISVPVTVGGNAISVIGDSHTEGADTTGGSTSGGHTGDIDTNGGDSLLGGNQLITPVSLPITIGGNAVSGIGDSTTEGATTTGGTSGGLLGDITTDGGDSLLGGNQLITPISLPITIGGNAVSVIGDSTTVGSETGTPGTPGTPGTSVVTGSVASVSSVSAMAPMASGDRALAATGVETGVAWGLLNVALIMLGLGGAVIARRRATA
ncbi:DUF320 domain-containing protein [Microbacterium sp. ACRRU]|uniref:chaplin family protein n=1 Tax=Microbacterium sp. ACRRU TaxID=2918204 RepID=UPI001EF52CA8|nr:chaplin family protein [Microbacterium sp. ACRRU]MCG7418197.1 DUF320 domain-containing protein [Microbacterium sp. ACRRU]